MSSANCGVHIPFYFSHPHSSFYFIFYFWALNPSLLYMLSKLFTSWAKSLAPCQFLSRILFYFAIEYDQIEDSHRLISIFYQYGFLRSIQSQQYMATIFSFWAVFRSHLYKIMNHNYGLINRKIIQWTSFPSFLKVLW